MIPCIKDILSRLLDGSYTLEQAEHWIGKHMELAAENADLRDHFAAQALPACIAVCINDEPSRSYPNHCALKAYEMADAMLEARTA